MTPTAHDSGAVASQTFRSYLLLMTVARESFRPMTFLGVSTTCAGLLWAAVFIYLLGFQNVPTRTFLSAWFFVAFFACFTFYYARVAIFVDDEGLTYRGILKTHRLGFKDIQNLQVLPGLVTVYAIQTAGNALHFTSFFSRHRRLAEILRDRAHLSKQL